MTYRPISLPPSTNRDPTVDAGSAVWSLVLLVVAAFTLGTAINVVAIIIGSMLIRLPHTNDASR